MCASRVMLAVLALWPGLAVAQSESPDYAAFSLPELSCTIGNNAAMGDHREGYNGVFLMTSPDEAAPAFVPLYAGLNLEHYFDARPRPEDRAVFFEPRHAPMTFRQIDDRTAELHQAPTPVYRTESWTRFELKEPHYIDMTFRCIPREAVYEGGFMGVFWASYINAPLDKSIYFMGPGGTLDAPKWQQFCTQMHGRDSAVRHEADAYELTMPAEGEGTLFNNLSPLRYSESFYYGRIRDNVLIYIFEPNPYLRFAHSPSGGGRTPADDDSNPAWDFMLVIPDYEVGKEYGLNMRAVYKKWEGRDDVIREVRKYRESAKS